MRKNSLDEEEHSTSNSFTKNSLSNSGEIFPTYKVIGWVAGVAINLESTGKEKLSRESHIYLCGQFGGTNVIGIPLGATIGWCIIGGAIQGLASVARRDNIPDIILVGMTPPGGGIIGIG